MKNNIQKADMFTQLITASVKPNLPVNQIYLKKKKPDVCLLLAFSWNYQNKSLWFIYSTAEKNYVFRFFSLKIGMTL